MALGQRNPNPAFAPRALPASTASQDEAARRGRRPAPVGEDRRATFVRLANARVSNAIDQIVLIGNLANKKNYRYGERDVEQMERALLKAVEMTIAAFRSPKATTPGFRLEDDEGDEFEDDDPEAC